LQLRENNQRERSKREQNTSELIEIGEIKLLDTGLSDASVKEKIPLKSPLGRASTEQNLVRIFHAPMQGRNVISTPQ